MRPPLTFTQAILRALTGSPGIAETVKMWLAEEPNTPQRVNLFACALAEDLGRALRGHVDEKDPDRWQQELHNALIEMVSERTNWARVAKALLRHFSTPVMLATPAGVRPTPTMEPDVRGLPSVN